MSSAIAVFVLSDGRVVGRDQVQGSHRLDELRFGVSFHRCHDLKELGIRVRGPEALVSCLSRRVPPHVNKRAIRVLAGRGEPVAHVAYPVPLVDLGGVVPETCRERVSLSRHRCVDAKLKETRTARLLCESPRGGGRRSSASSSRTTCSTIACQAKATRVPSPRLPTHTIDQLRPTLSTSTCSLLRLYTVTRHARLASSQVGLSQPGTEEAEVHPRLWSQATSTDSERRTDCHGVRLHGWAYSPMRAVTS